MLSTNTSTTPTLTFAPLPQRNRRTATCNRCRGQIRTGEGVAWQFQSPTLTNSPVVYFHPICSEQQAAEERALEKSAPALAVIGKALRFDEPLGFIDERRVRRALRQAGTNAPKLAAAIAGRIELGESLTVWDVVALIEDGA